MSSRGQPLRVPTIDEMEASDDQLPTSSSFKRGAIMAGIDSPIKSPHKMTPEFDRGDPTASSGHDRPGAARGPPAGASAFSSCFNKLAETARHEEVQKEFMNMKPEATVKDRSAPPVVNIGVKTNTVLVNAKQKGNPLLNFICQVPWEYEEIVPDYVMGQKTCALFLSLRYHNLFPEYIHGRLKELGRMYQLQVLLVMVDVKDPQHTLKEITKIAILTDCTLLLAWSPEEAGKYIETYKVMENKPPDMLMKRQEADSVQKVIDALTSVKSVNKRDAAVLVSTFGTLENIINASREDLGFCPGFGQQKADKLHKVLHERFLKNQK